ncbi:MAG TPA: adenylosuccinate lyase [Anaerolineales bacterium]
MPDELLAVSSLDGRYAAATEPLRPYFSEFAIIRGRIAVEVDYLITLSRDAGVIRPITAGELELLGALAGKFTLEDARENKDLERITRHDVKAVESFLRARLAPTSLHDLLEYLHFGLTSEDVNNIAQATALRDSRDAVFLPAIDKIMDQLRELARTHASMPMLARTHGQPAVPTTFGKEMAVFLGRLMKQRRALARHQFEAKLDGAVGNYNALQAAAPGIDWPAFSERFIRSRKLQPAGPTTQILPYDNWLDYFHIVMLINSILIGLAQDLWHYAGTGYIRLEANASEVGSSTMPQKVNPIDLENAEGNFGIANALLEHYARKLPISRLQRDLSDSTVRRTFGTALGHSLVGYDSFRRGLALVRIDAERMGSDLEAHWEIVAEGAQTILRAAGFQNPYEQLKQLTRGRVLTRESYNAWVDDLDVDEAIRSKLRRLSPLSYTGLAEQVARRAVEERSDNHDTPES